LPNHAQKKIGEEIKIGESKKLSPVSFSAGLKTYSV